MNVNTTGQITNPQSEYYTRIILERAEPLLVHDRWGMMRPLPRNNSKTIKFRRLGLFAASGSTPSGVLADIETNTTPLTEGVAPSGKFVGSAEVTANLQQYGDYATVTDMVDLTDPDPILTELAEMFGDQAGRSLDLIHRDQLVAGTNAFWSGSATSTATVDSIVDTDVFQAILRDLEGQAARKFTEMIRASTGIGTAPVRAAYWAACHTDVHMPDLDDLPEFQPANEYANIGPLAEGEVGALKNIRFIATTQARVQTGAGAATAAVKNTGGNADVYTTLVFGRDAYGISPLAGNALRAITKPLGSAGTADPLDQKATSGWKAITCPAKILNDNWMAVLESAASS